MQPFFKLGLNVCSFENSVDPDQMAPHCFLFSPNTVTAVVHDSFGKCKQIAKIEMCLKSN